MAMPLQGNNAARQRQMQDNNTAQQQQNNKAKNVCNSERAAVTKDKPPKIRPCAWKREGEERTPYQPSARVPTLPAAWVPAASWLNRSVLRVSSSSTDEPTPSTI